MTPPVRRRRHGPVPCIRSKGCTGTETGALIPGEDLATGHRNDRYITAYHGTAPSLFRKLMARWQTLAEHPGEETVFVDVGAGKGRAMLLAAEFPFRRIVGVELHPQLAAVARENLRCWAHREEGSLSAKSTDTERWGNRTLARSPTGAPMRLMEADAMQLRFPTGPVCLFLFNPFEIVLMDRFLARLVKQFAGREGLDLLYVNDEQRDLIAEEHPQFQQLWRGRIHLSHEDREADKATITHCADGLYVTTGYEDCSIYRLRV